MRGKYNEDSIINIEETNACNNVPVAYISVNTGGNNAYVTDSNPEGNNEYININVDERMTILISTHEEAINTGGISDRK